MKNCIAIAALLLLVLALPEYSAAQKLGICPIFHGDVGTCINECSDDNDCSDFKKCCGNGCGHVCTIPFFPVHPTPQPPGQVPKVGVCPFVDRSGIKCLVFRDECFSDKQCPCTQRCCNMQCGRRCVNAPVEIVKAGVCYQVPTPLILCKRVDSCLMDNDCPCNQKCCQMRCGKSCVAPAPVIKPGQCPFVLMNMMCIRFDRQCNNDADCPGALKCCSNPCGTSCMGPLQVRPGFCPVLHGNPVKCQIKCKQDRDCKQPLKCCPVGCSRFCLMPQLDIIPIHVETHP